MRGLWDNEKTLSPALLRSALAMVGAFLALCAAVMLLIAVASVAAGNYAAAAMQVAAGIALPFGLWLGLRMLADMLTILHRAHDRLAAIEHLAGGPQPEQEPGVAANVQASARPVDEAPAHPVDA